MLEIREIHRIIRKERKVGREKGNRGRRDEGRERRKERKKGWRERRKEGLKQLCASMFGHLSERAKAKGDENKDLRPGDAKSESKVHASLGEQFVWPTVVDVVSGYEGKRDSYDRKVESGRIKKMWERSRA